MRRHDSFNTDTFLIPVSGRRSLANSELKCVNIKLLEAFSICRCELAPHVNWNEEIFISRSSILFFFNSMQWRIDTARWVQTNTEHTVRMKIVDTTPSMRRRFAECNCQ